MVVLEFIYNVTLTHAHTQTHSLLKHINSAHLAHSIFYVQFTWDSKLNQSWAHLNTLQIMVKRSFNSHRGICFFACFYRFSLHFVWISIVSFGLNQYNCLYRCFINNVIYYTWFASEIFIWLRGDYERFFRRSVCMRVVHNRVVEKMNVALFFIADTNDRKKKKKTQIHDFRSNGPAEKKTANKSLTQKTRSLYTRNNYRCLFKSISRLTMSLSAFLMHAFWLPRQFRFMP